MRREPSKEEMEWNTMPVGTDEETLRRRFRVLAARLHPDSNDSEDAVERFQALAAEYERRLQECRSSGQRAELEAEWLAALSPFIAVAGVSTVSNDPIFAALATAVLGGMTLATEGAIWSDMATRATGKQRWRRKRRSGSSTPLLRAALAQLLPNSDAVTRQLLGVGGGARSSTECALAAEQLQEAMAAAEEELAIATSILTPLLTEAREAVFIAGSAAHARWQSRASVFSHGTAAVLLCLNGPAHDCLSDELECSPRRLKAMLREMATAAAALTDAEAVALSAVNNAVIGRARYSVAAARVSLLVEELGIASAQAQAAAAVEKEGQAWANTEVDARATARAAADAGAAFVSAGSNAVQSLWGQLGAAAREGLKRAAHQAARREALRREEREKQAEETAESVAHRAKFEWLRKEGVIARNKRAEAQQAIKDTSKCNSAIIVAKAVGRLKKQKSSGVVRRTEARRACEAQCLGLKIKESCWSDGDAKVADRESTYKSTFDSSEAESPESLATVVDSAASLPREVVAAARGAPSVPIDENTESAARSAAAKQAEEEMDAVRKLATQERVQKEESTRAMGKRCRPRRPTKVERTARFSKVVANGCESATLDKQQIITQQMNTSFAELEKNSSMEFPSTTTKPTRSIENIEARSSLLAVMREPRLWIGDDERAAAEEVARSGSEREVQTWLLRLSLGDVEEAKLVELRTALMREATERQMRLFHLQMEGEEAIAARASKKAQLRLILLAREGAKAQAQLDALRYATNEDYSQRLGGHNRSPVQ